MSKDVHLHVPFCSLSLHTHHSQIDDMQGCLYNSVDVASMSKVNSQGEFVFDKETLSESVILWKADM